MILRLRGCVEPIEAGGAASQSLVCKFILVFLDGHVFHLLSCFRFFPDAGALKESISGGHLDMNQCKF
jgi:hypothetical protein